MPLKQSIRALGASAPESKAAAPQLLLCREPQLRCSFCFDAGVDWTEVQQQLRTCLETHQQPAIAQDMAGRQGCFML